MMNLPAANAAPSHHPAGPAGLPPPAAPVAKPGGAGEAAAAAPGVAAALLDAAAAAAPAPFGALLGAMADAVAGDDAPAVPEAGAPSTAAEAQAAASMLPAMGQLPLAATPGATPGSVAAVAAALAGRADGRQQAQATALAAPDAARESESSRASAAAPLDARSALLAAALPVSGAALQAAASSPAPSARSSAGEVPGAALQALQGQAAEGSAAPLAAKDSASLLADSQRQPGEADGSAVPGFRSVLANTAGGQAADSLRLNGSPEQWQQPLRAALGDRLQLQLARNDERAVIRLEPPNMGSVEISVRHSGGALQVNIAASHSEVLRQLNAIGDAVRQDLSQRQFNEVAVTVSSSSARNLADGGQQQRQQQSEQQRQPGRALDEGEAGAATFALSGERE